MRSTHGRISWGDDGHAVESILRVELEWTKLDMLLITAKFKAHLRVPYSNWKRAFFYRLEQHGLRPLPLVHDDEEASDDCP